MVGPKQAKVKLGEDEDSARSVPGKVTGANCAELLSVALYVYGQTRPAPLRVCWEFRPEELADPGERLARVIGRLPARFAKVAGQALDPIMLIAGLAAVFSEGARREREVSNAFAVAASRGGLGGPGAGSATVAAPPTAPNQHRGAGGGGVTDLDALRAGLRAPLPE